ARGHRRARRGRSGAPEETAAMTARGTRGVVVLAVFTAMSLGASVARAQEVLIEADASPRAPEYQVRKVHGDIRFGAGFGFVAEDPIFSAEPSFGLDLRDIAPVQLRLGAPVRLRIYDRDPEQGPVVRNTEWDEVGDYLAILQRLHY